MKVEIEESKLQTAYANACDGIKDFMESLFGKKVFEAAKPTLVPRLRLRTLGSACAKKRKKRLSISGSNSLNFGLNI